MKEKFMRFMYGRYGGDSFGRFMMWTGIIMFLLSGFFRWNFLYYLALVILISECSPETFTRDPPRINLF